MGKLGNLHPAPGSRRTTKRLGRGRASGQGGTAGKGHKGQKARAGYNKKAWFEGGQMPLQRRIPKFGFTNLFREEYQVVNVYQLEAMKEGEKITPEVLRDYGLIKKQSVPVKILGVGEIKRPCEVEAHAFSASAESKILKAGGKVIKL